MTSDQAETFERIFSYVSPFLSAALASWFTYAAVRNQKLLDVRTTERLAAFKKVQRELVNLKRYCEAAAGELEMGDFASRLEGLPDGIGRTALSQMDALRVVVDEAQIFFSRSGRAELGGLVGGLGMLASKELTARSNPSVLSAATYLQMHEQAERCIDVLFAELRLPS